MDVLVKKLVQENKICISNLKYVGKEVSSREYDLYKYLKYEVFNRKTNENSRYNDQEENKHNICPLMYAFCR